MNEVTLRRAQLVLGWVTVFGRVYHHGTLPVPTRSTQPCIPQRSLNWVPASTTAKGWNVTSAGWQVTLCDPIWQVSSSSGQGHLEFPFWKLKIPPLASPQNSRCQKHDIFVYLTILDLYWRRNLYVHLGQLQLQLLCRPSLYIKCGKVSVTYVRSSVTSSVANDVTNSQWEWRYNKNGGCERHSMPRDVIMRMTSQWQ